MNARRNWMRQVIGSTVLFAPSPWAYVWAQGGAGQGAQLLKLPKIALVIGNAAYRQSPLKNPANDALGMAETLNATGFEVTLRLEASRSAMQATIDAYVKQLAARKCVGLFYFAGHGIQFNWKNYLLPVDAQVASNADVEKQGIEVNALAAGLARAGNPMNLIILDACRDAPFGEASKPEQKGLSQMDAPPGTLLAYATAPGNVASDGEGSHGLYTENLLREAKVPEARVEDVFKRVRLNVRRRSNGAQVPWESTSLEEDYYFVPPSELAVTPDVERVRRFADELRLWERTALAGEPAPFDDYLKRHPDGQFADLARSRREAAVALQAKLREEDRQRRVAAEAAAWQRVGTQAGLPDIEEFLRQHPAGANAQAARARRDRLVAEREAKLLAEAPKVAAVRTEQDRERRYAEEARLWGEAERASSPRLVEDYLRRYPSGYFAELAQFRLDRLLAQAGEKRIEIPSQKGNPYSAGTQRVDTAFRVGDTWLYRVSDPESGKLLRNARRTVTAITDTEVQINNGQITWDLMGNLRKRADGRTEVGAQYMPGELAIGRAWVSRHDMRNTNQPEPNTYVVFQFRVAARETISVPAGSFDCFRIDGKGVSRAYLGPNNSQLTWVRWMAPESRQFIRQDYSSVSYGRGGPPTREINERFELVSFRHA
ncbi:MAG: caspase family protein [Burkholderiales bacterium]|nr:caspase family protein [Burkholderiales bacterium]